MLKSILLRRTDGSWFIGSSSFQLKMPCLHRRPQNRLRVYLWQPKLDARVRP